MGKLASTDLAKIVQTFRREGGREFDATLVDHQFTFTNISSHTCHPSLYMLDEFWTQSSPIPAFMCHLQLGLLRRIRGLQIRFILPSAIRAG